MSGLGVEPEDMRRSSLIDDKLDRLLAERSAVAGDELAAELSLMLEQLDQAFPVAVLSEQVEDAHVARMMEAAAELRAPVTAPMVAARSSLLDRTRAGLTRKVAGVTLALTTVFGGAAYAGVLPAPVQRAAASAAAVVGLDLPWPNDDGSDEPGAIYEERETGERQITEGRSQRDHRGDAVSGAFEGTGGRGADGTGSGDEPVRGDRDDRGEADDDEEDSSDGSRRDSDSDDADSSDDSGEKDSDELDDESHDGTGVEDSYEADEPDEEGSLDDDIEAENGSQGSSESGFDSDDSDSVDVSDD